MTSSLSTRSSSVVKSFIQASSSSNFSSDTNSIAGSNEVSISSSFNDIEEKSNPSKVSSNNDSFSSMNSFSQFTSTSLLINADLSFSKLSNKSSRFFTSNSSASSGLLKLIFDGTIFCNHSGISPGSISSSSSSSFNRFPSKLSTSLLNVSS